MAGRYSLRFRDDRGVRGGVTLSLPPEGRASYEALLVVPEIGVVLVRDHDVPPPRGALIEVRAEGLWAEFVCETPGEHWSLGLEAFGLRFDTEEEANESPVGDRVPVGLDLEWERGDQVHGELLIGRDRIAFDGVGEFATEQ